MCIEQECQNLTTLINNLTCPVGNNGLICSGVNVGVSMELYTTVILYLENNV